ncbi:MAG TPA: glycosyltransferase family 9 protein [Acetobacteraceae bacterium]
MLAQASERDAVASLVGRVALSDLPTLLRGCDLHVGNNIGPKHIAAALGVPTAGVHSAWWTRRNGRRSVRPRLRWAAG